MTTPVSESFPRYSDKTLGFLTWLVVAENIHDVDVLPDGRWVGIKDFLFTAAIVVGKIGDMNGMDDRWCYHNEGDARAALVAWDGTGEPLGWHRHPGSGRRRAADGTLYVRP